MTTTKTQLNVRVPKDVADAAGQAAKTRHMTVAEYIESLVRSDTDPTRAAFLAEARDVIEQFGDLIEDRAARDRG